MTPFSHRSSALFLPWIFAICAVTACSSSDSTSPTTGPGGTSALACQGGPPPDPDSFLTETLTTGFTILSANSKRNSTGPDGLRWSGGESSGCREARQPQQ